MKIIFNRRLGVSVGSSTQHWLCRHVKQKCGSTQNKNKSWTNADEMAQFYQYSEFLVPIWCIKFNDAAVFYIQMKIMRMYQMHVYIMNWIVRTQLHVRLHIHRHALGPTRQAMISIQSALLRLFPRIKQSIASISQSTETLDVNEKHIHIHGRFRIGFVECGPDDKPYSKRIHCVTFVYFSHTMCLLCPTYDSIIHM